MKIAIGAILTQPEGDGMGKKRIEVALPLEAINKASAREKSIRHGHHLAAPSRVYGRAQSPAAVRRCAARGLGYSR